MDLALVCVKTCICPASGKVCATAPEVFGLTDVTPAFQTLNVMIHLMAVRASDSIDAMWRGKADVSSSSSALRFHAKARIHDHEVHSEQVHAADFRGYT